MAHSSYWRKRRNGRARLFFFFRSVTLISSTGMNNYAEHRPTDKKTSRLHWNATAGDVLQFRGEADHQPLPISQPFNWWRLRRREPGLPDTWFITEGAPVLRCPGARSSAAVVMTFARLSELKRAWFFIFFFYVRVIYPPTNIFSRKTRSVRLFSGRDMGERVEPMQWIVARHRQNSGERDEEPGEPDSPGRSRRVEVQGKSARLRTNTVTRLLLPNTHFRPHPRRLGPGNVINAAVLMWMWSGTSCWSTCWNRAFWSCCAYRPVGLPSSYRMIYLTIYN